MDSKIIWKPGKIRILDDNKRSESDERAKKSLFIKEEVSGEAKLLLEKIKENPSKRFLVIGRVQSGKTRFFLDLIYHSFLTSEFNVVIILCGVTNKLKDQTLERLEGFFKNEKQAINEVIQDWKELHSAAKNKLFNIPPHVKLVLLTVKNPSNLRQIKTKAQLFIGKKVLIIDDEADQASLNTNSTKPEKNPTIVNDQIVGILKNLSQEKITFNYVGITATPYANVFLEKSDPLSVEFIWALSSKEGYVGLEEVCSPEENGKFFVLLNEEEKDDYKSLKKSINTYLVGSMLSELSKTEMLIHTDRLRSEHKKIAELVKGYIEKLNGCAKKVNPFDADYGWLTDQMKEGLKVYQYPCNEVTGKQKEIFLSIIKKVGIKIVNSSNISEDSDYFFTIYIGGNIFERGKTLEHLLVSFFTRKNNNLDHTIQRCRWFGYRENTLLKWMRIFTTIDTRQQLEDAWYADKEFIDNLPGEEEDEQELKLYLPKKIKPFRNGIVDLHYVKENYHSKFKQEKICENFEKDRKIEEGTLEDEWSFWEKLIREGKPNKYYPEVIKEIEKDNFYQLSEYIGGDAWEQIIKKCSNFDLQKEHSLRKLIEETNSWSSEHLVIKILLMRPGQQFSERKMFGKKPKINIFVGPDKRFGHYLGDEKLFDLFPENKNKILLYVYKVKVVGAIEKIRGEDKKEIGKGMFYALKFPNFLVSTDEEKGHYLRLSKKNE